MQYLFQNAEVILTGRTAVKKSPKDKTKIIDTLLEIEPADKNGPTWKKWVRPTDLYTILDNEK